MGSVHYFVHTYEANHSLILSPIPSSAIPTATAANVIRKAPNDIAKEIMTALHICLVIYMIIIVSISR